MSTATELCSLEIESAAFFKNTLMALNALGNDDVRLAVDPAGIRSIQLSPDHVAMVNMNLPKAIFNEFKCPTLVEFQAPGALLQKLFPKAVPRSASLALRIELRDKNLRLIAELRGASLRRISLPVDPYALETAMKDQVKREHPIVKATIGMHAFTAAIQEFNRLKATFFVLTITDDSLEIKCTEDYFEASCTFRQDMPGTVLGELTVPEGVGPQHVHLNIDRVCEVATALCRTADVATVEFSNDEPLIMRATPLWEGTDATLEFFIAPRVE